MVVIGSPEEARARPAHPLHEAAASRAIELEVGRELARVLVRVDERELLGRGVDEEVERVDHRHVGHQVDRDLQLARLLREHQPRDPVAVRVLLPVEEVLRRLDLERVALDRRAAMRGGPQPHLVRRQSRPGGRTCSGSVVERDLDRHWQSPVKTGSTSGSPVIGSRQHSCISTGVQELLQVARTADEHALHEDHREGLASRSTS